STCGWPARIARTSPRPVSTSCQRGPCSTWPAGRKRTSSRMSEAAVRKHDMKRNWAEPGSQHDRLVRLAKIGLPIVAVAFLVILAIAPFDQRGGDVSFILDKKGVDKAAERMRIETARYTGEDNKGDKFEITANRAIQPTSDQPIVNIEGMMARLGLGQGPVVVA